MCSGKRGWEVRDPGCGRRLLLRWDPELKCSKEQGQVHTAPCLPLPAARGPPAWPPRSTEPLQDTGQVSYTPPTITAFCGGGSCQGGGDPVWHHWALGDLVQLLWWQQTVGCWRCPSPAPPSLLVGMGWNERRDLGHFGLAEQGPHPTVAMPGGWMWQWGGFWQQEEAGMPARCQQGRVGGAGTLLLVAAVMPGVALATLPVLLLHNRSALCPASVAAVVQGPRCSAGWTLRWPRCSKPSVPSADG